MRSSFPCVLLFASRNRAADEGRITDTNLYLFGRNATFAQHLYATTGRLRFECPPGDYRLYVVANRHADLGERTEARLRR